MARLDTAEREITDLRAENRVLRADLDTRAPAFASDVEITSGWFFFRATIDIAVSISEVAEMLMHTFSRVDVSFQDPHRGHNTVIGLLETKHPTVTHVSRALQTCLGEAQKGWTRVLEVSALVGEVCASVMRSATDYAACGLGASVEPDVSGWLTEPTDWMLVGMRSFLLNDFIICSLHDAGCCCDVESLREYLRELDNETQ